MIAKLLLQNLLWPVFLGALLFGAAGTLDWPRAWIFLAEMTVLGIAAGLWLARHDPALLRERLRAPVQRGQPAMDKLVTGTLLLASCLWLVLMGLDAGRYRWSAMPEWLAVVGALALPVFVWACCLVFRANSFAAPVVKLQEERGQQVASTGPYRTVRHPMYASAILYFLAVALLLGSWWGLAAVPVLVALLGLRIWIEERTLMAGLPGYADYAARVRYRLVPGLW